MSQLLTFSTAGNVLAPALAALNALGFRVSVVAGERSYRAENEIAVVTASDTVQLLGLAVLALRRGVNSTRPTDSEVGALLRLEGAA